MSTIIYTKVDEAPLLAIYSFLPVIKAFSKNASLQIQSRDISLAGRILANFPDFLSEDQKKEDDLEILGNLTQNPDTNIIKLPNISASIPQLKAAISELRSKGFLVPEFPENPSNEEEEKIKNRYAKVLGSAVNPVLREGNSDRRAPKSVKDYAKANPHFMGEWDKDNKSHVASMQNGDFYANELSHTFAENTKLKVLLKGEHEEKILKEFAILSGEIVDATFLSAKAYKKYIAEEMTKAKNEDLLLSIHLKATMMKVSDPIMFGFTLEVYFAKLFEQFADEFAKVGVNPNNGLADLLKKISSLPEKTQNLIKAKIDSIMQENASLAMVNSDKGITNLHMPNDVIIDASMPVVIRNSGQMWDKNGNLKQTKALIPDRSYAGVYQAVIDDCKANGALDPKSMGSVPNVGLMAKKAEEYGSHDKTFQIPFDGEIRVTDEKGECIFSLFVEKNDIFRMCQAKDEAIKNWVSLAVSRARLSQTPAIFWLDENRAHDREIIKKVNLYLKDEDLSGLDISILSPIKATKESLKRMREGKDTISVTGNVLRDFNTDLFPILEVGTSAKMLSIVPLMRGGGLFETGAGGSAPKHVEQLLQENHLRWDSLGEFMALAASYEFVGEKEGNKKAKILAKSLDEAVGEYLLNNKSPSRKIGEIDNRGSQFYLTLYWAKALSKQDEDKQLKDKFSQIYDKLQKNENAIMQQINSVQGQKVDLGGYYLLDEKKASLALRPSEIFNSIIDEI